MIWFWIMLCKVGGHRWQRLGVNRGKNSCLAHLHHHAGVLSVCRVCGLVWDDFLWMEAGRLPAAAEQMKHYNVVRERLRMWSKRHGVKLRD